MIIAPLADVKARFSEYIKKTQDGPVVVTKNGKPVVLLLNITDEDDLERILFANSNKFQAMLDAAEAAKLPKMEQDALAEWILAELASERRWDEAFLGES